jgi:hypothetical protein
VDGSTASDEDVIKVGPVPVVLYAAMLGATIGGQLVGIAIDVSVGSRGFWIPAVCSMVFEAVVGARVGAARTGRALTAAESGQVSAYYSVGLLAISVPLAVWTCVARARDAAIASASPNAWWALALPAAFGILAVGRWGLMVALTPRPR